MHVNVFLSLERAHLNQPHYKSAVLGPGLPDGTGWVVTGSEFLGHSCIEMTLGDTHPSSENKRRAVQCLNGHCLDTNSKSTADTDSVKLLNLRPSARSSAWIERWSPEPKVTGSNPVGRTILTVDFI